MLPDEQSEPAWSGDLDPRIGTPTVPSLYSFPTSSQPRVAARKTSYPSPPDSLSAASVTSPPSSPRLVERWIVPGLSNTSSPDATFDGKLVNDYQYITRNVW